MYMIPSTPLTCCSIGAATESATSLALAPGYVHVTWTVGGVTCGNCASGRYQPDINPARVITIDSTAAKIGRSMKNRLIMGDDGVWCWPCTHLGRAAPSASQSGGQSPHSRSYSFRRV